MFLKPSKIDVTLKKAVQTLSQIEMLYEDATTVRKREIVSSMLPDNLCFDGENYRTLSMNKVGELISSLAACFGEIKTG